MGKVVQVKRDISWLTNSPITHRGLHREGSDFPENSMAAIMRSVEQGYPVEIDVRITLDGQVVVFHDKTLDRMTGKSGQISKTNYNEIKNYTLGNSQQTIPLLADMLDEINERVPVFIEVKSSMGEDPSAICAGVRFCSEGYKGKIAAMSFNPLVVSWMRDYAPQFARGLLLDYRLMGAWLKHISAKAAIRKTTPDFLGVDVDLLPNKLAKWWRKQDRPLLCWTVANAQQEAIGRAHTDALIFEEPAVQSTPLPEAPRNSAQKSPNQDNR